MLAPPLEDADANAAQQQHHGYSTKIRVLVETMLELRRRDPLAKSLVFSQWEGALDLVEAALGQNDIRCARLGKGGSGRGGGRSKKMTAVDRFKNDPSVTALLLSIQHGANGLNLTEATHVVRMLCISLFSPPTSPHASPIYPPPYRRHRTPQSQPCTPECVLLLPNINALSHVRLLTRICFTPIYTPMLTSTYRTTPYNTIQRCTTPYYTVLHRTTPYYTVLHRTTVSDGTGVECGRGGAGD